MRAGVHTLSLNGLIRLLLEDMNSEILLSFVLFSFFFLPELKCENRSF